VHVAMHKDESLFGQKYTRDGARLYTAAYDGRVRVMDTGAGCEDRMFGTTVYTHNTKGSNKKGIDFGQWLTAMDMYGDTLVFTDVDGYMIVVDPRKGTSPVKSARLHQRKAGGLAVCPHKDHLFATSSLDGTVCLWDMRLLKEALHTETYGRAVTSVSWDPHDASGTLASTCWDDHVRLHHNLLSGDPAVLEVEHNNQTGRWITPFRPVWDPKTTGGLSRLFIGNMDRGLDAMTADGVVTSYYAPELLTSQPAANAVHSALDIVVSGTASGRLALWTPAP
jgi:WD repeat-containing protein 76